MASADILDKKSPISAGESTSSGSQENRARNQNNKIRNKGLLSDSIKGKKKSKRKAALYRKTKPSPVFKVDEETLTTSTSDNTTNTPEDLEMFSQTNSPTGSNSSSEDEALLNHIVLSRVLNRKKLELLESTGEVINALMNRN